MISCYPYFGSSISKESIIAFLLLCILSYTSNKYEYKFKIQVHCLLLCSKTNKTKKRQESGSFILASLFLNEYSNSLHIT